MEFKLRKWNEADLCSLVTYANNANVAKWLTNALFKNGEFMDEIIYSKFKN